MNDFLRDETTGGMLIQNGDLVVGDSTKKHQRSLLLVQKGGLKQSPLSCVGVRDFMDDENPEELLREMRKQYSADGMEVNYLAIQPNGDIGVDAEYK